MRPIALGKIRTNAKLGVSNVFLIANAFVWYMLAFSGLTQALTQLNASSSESLSIVGLNILAITLTGLVGTFLADRVGNRQRFLYLWLLVGLVISLMPLVLSTANLTVLAIISVIFGSYFGFGMPTTMGYHSSFTSSEGRAKIGGFTFLIIFAMFGATEVIHLQSIVETCLVLTFLRFIALIVFKFVIMKQPVETKNKDTIIKYRALISNKSFILYFIPWCMFTLINFLTTPIQKEIFADNIYTLLGAVEFIFAAVVSVVCGFLADRYGRKRLSIIGFIMVGIGYAVIGLFKANGGDMLMAGIIYMFSDGIAWGIFYVLFLFTLWGDLGHKQHSDKIYFLGALPYIIAYSMGLIFKPTLSGISPETIFQFASVFLFVAVLPLIYAPETLSEKHMKDQELKNYIEKAQKLAQKEDNKDKKEEKEEQEKTSQPEQPAESSNEEIKKAQELAEKYY
jgi:MFS family permease